MLFLVAAAPAPAGDRQQEEEARARRDEALLARIIELVADGEFALADEELDQAGEVAGRDPRWLNLRGLALAGLHRHEEAVRAYEAGLRRDPGMAALHRNLAISLVALAARGRALSEFGQAVELDPGDAEGWLGLASLQTELGRYEDARSSLERLDALRPADPRTWRVRAALAGKTADRELELQAWGWLDEHVPDAGTARQLGDLHRTEAPAQALAHYLECFHRDPAAADCRQQATLLALTLGQPDQAVQASEPALDALSEAGYLNLLLSGQALGDADRLEGWVERRPPASPEGWGVVALVRRADGRPAAAVEAVESGLELAETADLYNLLGVLRAEAGRVQEARVAWRKALEIDPDHGPARDNLAEHPPSP